jgi:hypothetical protein
MARKIRALGLFGVFLFITLNLYSQPLWLMKNSSCNVVELRPIVIPSLSRWGRWPREQQQIIFLAGPHKTGSTSIQVNLVSWSQEGLLGPWRWGINDTTCVFENISELRQGRKPKNRKIELLFAKGFSPLMNLLANTRKNYPEKEEDQSALIDCYRNQLSYLWQDGYNIVLGSEAADFGIRSKVDADKFIHGILNIMPMTTNDDANIRERITFVITYRYPRVDHFVSYWHMAGRPPPLREWTLQQPYELHPLNPLGLANLYLDFGFRVIILDTSGLQKDNVDLSNAVACDM